MPEGDTIHRTAAQLRRVLKGQTICDAVANGTPNVASDRISGRVVTATEALGKHLLIHLDNGHVIHTHMGMTGSWHVYSSGQAWHKPAHRASLVLKCPAAECVCFTPKTLEVLSAVGLRRHPFLSRLGPDLLGERFDIDEVIKRLRQQPDTSIGQAVMDQRIVSGIGNVYKSELLFLEQLNPFVELREITDEQLRQLFVRSRSTDAAQSAGASSDHAIWS